MSTSMRRPMFSIIIPSYNRAHTIERAVRSCLDQTYQDFEITITDDERSTDNIESIISRIGDRRIRLIKGRWRTAAASRNSGIDLAQGRYIAFLDSDDAFLPHKLEICLGYLEKQENLVLYSQVYMDRGVGKFWIKPSRGLQEGEDIMDYLFIEKGWITTSTIVLGAEQARQSKFDECLPFGQDLQFSIDLWQKGLTLVMLGQPLVFYDDTLKPERVSQEVFRKRRNKAASRDFINWITGQRARMSDHAYRSCYASIISRLIARDAPGEAFGYIWTAYRHGTFDTSRAATQCVQTFAPHLYRKLSDLVVRYRGIEPPKSVQDIQKC